MNAAVIGAACSACFVLGYVCGVFWQRERAERARWRQWYGG